MSVTVILKGLVKSSPKIKKQESGHGISYSLNNVMVTYQLGDQTRLPVHEILGTQPQEGRKKEVTVEIDLDPRMPET